jgi:hypothetical protein
MEIPCASRTAENLNDDAISDVLPLLMPVDLADERWVDWLLRRHILTSFHTATVPALTLLPRANDPFSFR